MMRRSLAPATHLAPSLRAVPFLKTAADSGQIQLTERQRAELARIGMRLRLPPRMVIYEAETDADSVFAIVEGAVKSYRELPSGKRAVTAFLFARDLFGLAENGRYVNCTQAITSLTVYRLPLTELTVLLKHDSEMQFHFLRKVTHELREAQRRAILANRRDAAGRLAMFLALMRERQNIEAGDQRLIPLPMTRSDIANFLGLTLEAVSRAAVELERRGLVKFEGRHAAKIVDGARLAKLVNAV